MSDTLNHRILNSLASRADDKQELSQFAVACIHHVENLSELPEPTRLALFDAMSADEDLYLYQFRLNRLLVDHDYTYPRIKIEHYKKAYQKLLKTLPQKQYSAGFTEKIWQSLSETLLISKYDGDWQQTLLQEKITWLNAQALLFLDHYDREKILHAEGIFNSNKIVKLATDVLSEDIDGNSQSRTGCYSQVHNVIFFQRYAIKYFDDDYIQKYQPKPEIDYQETKALLDNPDVLEKFSFSVEKSVGGQHIQYNEDDKELEYQTPLGDETAAKAIMAHELFHMLTYRLFRWYQVAPADIAEEYLFTEEDYRLHIASIVGYTPSGEDFEEYLQNREEVTAHQIDGRFIKEALVRNPRLAP